MTNRMNTDALTDAFLKELPDVASGIEVSIDDLIYNLRALQGLFLARGQPRAMLTAWQAEQVINSLTSRHNQ